MNKPTMWFLNRSNINKTAQAQKIATDLESRGTFYPCSVSVTAKLICAFVSAYANCLSSHEAAQMLVTIS